jgi:predicted Co/Zn/Cd cation transporter (cation efflux family)
LVAAEATQWFAGGVLGAGMLVAFLASHFMHATSWAPATRYVDPGLVLAACAGFLPSPVNMIRTTFTELVEGTPDREIEEPLRVVVDEVLDSFGIENEELRISKVGRKIYVEIEVVVSPEWRVAQSDAVRRALREHLAASSLDVWLTLEFASHADLI